MRRLIAVIVGVLTLAAIAVASEQVAAVDPGTHDAVFEDALGDAPWSYGDVSMVRATMVNHTVDLTISRAEPGSGGTVDELRWLIDTDDDTQADYEVVMRGTTTQVMRQGTVVCGTGAPARVGEIRTRWPTQITMDDDCLGEPSRVSVAAQLSTFSTAGGSWTDRAPDSGMCCRVVPAEPDGDAIDPTGDAGDGGDVWRIEAAFGTYAESPLTLTASSIGTVPGKIVWALDTGGGPAADHFVTTFPVDGQLRDRVTTAAGTETCREGDDGPAGHPAMIESWSPGRSAVKVNPGCFGRPAQVRIFAQIHTAEHPEVVADTAPDQGMCCQVAAPTTPAPPGTDPFGPPTTTPTTNPMVRSPSTTAPYQTTTTTMATQTATTAMTHTPSGSPPVAGYGYWMVGADGLVYAFGDAQPQGNAAVGAAAAVDLEPTPTGRGYWIVDDAGRIHRFGDAADHGDASRASLAKGERVTGLSVTRSGDGYWLFTSRGRVLTFGDAAFLGDVSHLTLNGPVLDSTVTPSGQGYYMVASDGGVFSFGDARFHGSMGGYRLNAPVQSLVPDRDGAGYWLVASDGGIFAFDAVFQGSLGAVRLNRPVTGMVRAGTGYLMVGEDGGIFDFSGDPNSFKGSLGANPPARPITAVALLEG